MLVYFIVLYTIDTTTRQYSKTTYLFVRNRIIHVEIITFHRVLIFSLKMIRNRWKSLVKEELEIQWGMLRIRIGCSWYCHSFLPTIYKLRVLPQGADNKWVRFPKHRTDRRSSHSRSSFATFTVPLFYLRGMVTAHLFATKQRLSWGQERHTDGMYIKIP